MKQIGFKNIKDFFFTSPCSAGFIEGLRNCFIQLHDGNKAFHPPPYRHLSPPSLSCFVWRTVQLIAPVPCLWQKVGLFLCNDQSVYPRLPLCNKRARVSMRWNLGGERGKRGTADREICIVRVLGALCEVIARIVEGGSN